MKLEELRAMSSGRIDHNNPEYRVPLEREARPLSEHCGKAAQILFLGSIATQNYVAPLFGYLASDWCFPATSWGAGT